MLNAGQSMSDDTGSILACVAFLLCASLLQFCFLFQLLISMCCSQAKLKHERSAEWAGSQKVAMYIVARQQSGDMHMTSAVSIQTRLDHVWRTTLGQDAAENKALSDSFSVGHSSRTSTLLVAKCVAKCGYTHGTAAFD